MRRSLVAVLAIGLASTLAACGGGESDPAGDPSADAPWVPVSFAEVVTGREEACEQVAEDIEGDGPADDAGTPRPPGDVERDLEAVQEHLLGDSTSKRVLSVGLRDCFGHWVIDVQAATSLATIPATGPEGTPVLAYRERGVRQICTMQVGNECE